MGQQSCHFQEAVTLIVPPQSLYLCPSMNAGWSQRMPVAFGFWRQESEWKNKINAETASPFCLPVHLHSPLHHFQIMEVPTGKWKHWGSRMTAILQSALAAASSRWFFLLLDQFDCQPFTTKQSALLTVGYFGEVVCKLEKAKTCFSSQLQIISEIMILKNIKCCSHVFSGVSPYDECFHNSSRPLYDCYGISPGSVIVWIWVSDCQGVGVWLGLIQDIQTHISITENCTDMERCGKWNRSLV